MKHYLTMTESAKPLVFAYGTLKKGEPNHKEMVNSENGLATFLGTGETVDKYPLVVGTELNIPFLMQLKGQGHNVRGDIYEVDEKMMEHLDEFECVPKVYIRSDIEIRLIEDPDGKPAKPNQIKNCGVYFLSENLDFLLQNKQIADYHSIAEDHPEYVPRSARVGKKSLLEVLFPMK